MTSKPDSPNTSDAATTKSGSSTPTSTPSPHGPAGLTVRTSKSSTETAPSHQLPSPTSPSTSPSSSGASEPSRSLLSSTPRLPPIDTPLPHHYHRPAQEPPRQWALAWDCRQGDKRENLGTAVAPAYRRHDARGTV